MNVCFDQLLLVTSHRNRNGQASQQFLFLWMAINVSDIFCQFSFAYKVLCRSLKHQQLYTPNSVKLALASVFYNLLTELTELMWYICVNISSSNSIKEWRGRGGGGGGCLELWAGLLSASYVNCFLFSNTDQIWFRQHQYRTPLQSHKNLYMLSQTVCCSCSL
jgi:hypothetical protein